MTKEKVELSNEIPGAVGEGRRFTAKESENSELANEIAAYWTRLAYDSIIAFTRASLVKRGCTQPQFWLLRHLSTQDLASDERGRTLAELERAMRDYLRDEDDLASAADALVTRGWLTRDGQRLRITDLGEDRRLDIVRHAPDIRAQIHAGVDDADYITTVKTLQQMVRNCSGARV